MTADAHAPTPAPAAAPRDHQTEHRGERVGTYEQPTARAIQVAWLVWVALVLVALGAMLLATSYVLNAPATATRPEGGLRWAWGTGTYLGVAVPAALFWRGRQFRGYWHHQPVAPRAYLVGMSVVWAALAVGALLAGVACVATRTLFPNGALAAVAVVCMLTLWPKGNAMTRPVGNPGDVGEYEEPR